ncbi:MAG: DNA-protecting protein DprA, partial [Okeania sp. SIO2H7]|nr:DNA-protecting protein DprA [Okeania sp. SIO2H7]
MEERAYWLAWSGISGIGPIVLQKLQQHFGTLAQAWGANRVQLGQVAGIGRQTIEKIEKERSRLNPQQLLEEHLVKNPNFWTPADADYPCLLQEIPSPPPVLYYRGIVNPEENQGITPTIGIVGTRSPSEYGRRWTRKIAATLAKSGFTIVSGLAAGIDSEAHRGCLEAGGRTIAVFGTGVDRIYPKENKALAEQVLEGGLIISEYPAGTNPNSRHFPQRNRIIAGLSRAVLITEAPHKSGALITADIANDFGRDVYVLPARLDDEKSHGCLDLINSGAQVIPVEMEQLLEMLGGIPQLDLEKDSSEQLSLFETTASEVKFKTEPEPVKTPDLEPELARVLEAIALEETPFDII